VLVVNISAVCMFLSHTAFHFSGRVGIARKAQCFRTLTTFIFRLQMDDQNGTERSITQFRFSIFTIVSFFITADPIV
jgi:hypothetical protein